MDICVLLRTWRGFGPVLSELLEVFNGSGTSLILTGRCTTLKLTHWAYKEQEAARISLRKRRLLVVFFYLFTNSDADVDKNSMFGKVCWFGFTLLLKPNGRRTCNLLKKKCHSTVFTFLAHFVLFSLAYYTPQLRCVKRTILQLFLDNCICRCSYIAALFSRNPIT